MMWFTKKNSTAKPITGRFLTPASANPIKLMMRHIAASVVQGLKSDDEIWMSCSMDKLSGFG